jgi:hypothetical protein
MKFEMVPKYFFKNGIVLALQKRWGIFSIKISPKKEGDHS